MKRFVIFLNNIINNSLRKYWKIHFITISVILVSIIWDISKLPGHTFIEPLTNFIYSYILIFGGITYLLGFLSWYIVEKNYKNR